MNKTEKSILKTKQKRITRAVGIPQNTEGRDGEFSIRNVIGQGIFLFYKWGNRWFSSRFSSHIPTTHERKEPIYLPKGVKPRIVGELTMSTDGKVLTKKDASINQVISIDKNNVVDSTEVHLSRAETSDMDDDNAKNPEFLFTNSGHCHLRLVNTAVSTSDVYDVFMSFAKRHPEDPWNMRRWICGFDTSAGEFVIGYKSAASSAYSTDTVDTPSSSLTHKWTFGATSVTNFPGDLVTTGSVTCTSLISSGPASFSSTPHLTIDKEPGTTNPTNFTPGLDGIALHIDTFIMNDNNTSEAGTANQYYHNVIEAPTLTATNASVTTTTASTLWISGAPIASTNQAFGDSGNNKYALHIRDGKLKYDGTLGTAFQWDIATAATLNVQGDIALSADGGNVTMDDGTTTVFDFDVDGVNLKIMDDADTGDYCNIGVGAAGATSITTVDDGGETAHLTLAPDGDLIITTDHNTGQVTIDKNSTNTATATNTAMQIDLDHTGISASGQTITNVALDLDMNCESVTHVGTVNQIGVDIDMEAVDDGTQTNTGIDINVSGGNNNYGMNITTADEDGDYHIKLMHGGDVNDYATFHVQNTGDLTIATVGDGSLNSDLILDVDGDIELNADGGQIYFKDASADLAEIDAKGIRSHSGSFYMAEVASAASDTITQGQLWTRNDDPQNLMFTDGDGTDYNILRPTSTAVWGGALARVGASGTHFSIPTGHLVSNIDLGTGSSPATTLTCATNADDIVGCVWFSLQAIKIISCTIMTGEGGGTNTGHTVHLMRYDIDADGDWSSGTIVGSAAPINNDDYSQARKIALTMSGTAANLLVSTSQILVGTVEMISAYNSYTSAKVVLQYQEVQ